MLRYNYSYKNDTAKTAKIKITRQLLNNKNKVVSTVSAIKSLKAGETFAKDVNQMISRYSAPGDYNIKVKVADLTNKQNYETSFKLTVEKLKYKYFELGSVASTDSAVFFDPASLARIKSDKKLPTTVGLKYGYENKTEAKQTLKMIRELIDAAGHVINSRSAKWVMVPAEKYAIQATQYLGSTLGAGNYSIRIRALDWKTKALVADNSLGVSIILK